MRPRVTRHAKQRMKSRSISAGSARRASYGSKRGGSKKFLGAGKYKSTSGGVTTVYKVKNGRKIIITTYREDK